MHHAFVAERIGGVGDDVFRFMCSAEKCIAWFGSSGTTGVRFIVGYIGVGFVAEYGVSKPFSTSRCRMRRNRDLLLWGLESVLAHHDDARCLYVVLYQVEVGGAMPLS